MKGTKIYGIIEFRTPLFCSASVLSKSVKIEIGGIKGKLLMPSLPEWDRNVKDPLSLPLLPPNPIKTKKFNDKLFDWGSPQSYPNGNSLVRLALIEFKLKNNFEEAAQKIYKGVDNWLNLFEKYVILMTKQGTYNMISISQYGRNIKLFKIDDNKIVRISNPEVPNIKIRLLKEDKYLNYNQLVKAASYSSKLIEPKFEYKILLESYYARKEGDYRKAIIEAGTALEICLSAKIVSEFKNQKIRFGDKLLKKFKMLSGKFELAKLIGIKIPDKDYKKLIIEPRNDIVHRGIYPDQNLTNQVISEVEKILSLLSPKYYEEKL